MMAFAGDDADVKAQLYKDRMSDYDDGFVDTEDDTDDTMPLAWTSKLKATKNGELAQTIENAVIVLRNDPRLAGCVAMDDMEHAIVVQHDLPWRKLDTAKSTDLWRDGDDAALRLDRAGLL